MARGDAAASSASTASPAAGAGIALNATPDDDGRLSLSAGDLRFALDAPDCRRSGTMLLVCDEATLVVTRAGAPAQTLRPAVLYVNPSATLYRGPSDGRDRSKSHTLRSPMSTATAPTTWRCGPACAAVTAARPTTSTCGTPHAGPSCAAMRSRR